jgi:release factor glutamine methyltransferase
LLIIRKRIAIDPGSMLPTPSTSHVCFDNVYEPAEDSFLFLDTLSSPQEVQFLKHQFPNGGPAPVILEVGTGSGVVVAFLTSQSMKILGREDVMELATDVNREACQAATQTIYEAMKSEDFKCGISLGTIQMDLASAICPGIVDILLFNPPYVPSEETPEHLQSTLISANFKSKFEQSSNLLALSYAGGLNGMETTDRLLDDLPRVLNPDRGVAYVLLCAQNKPDEVMRRIKSWDSLWHVEIAGHSGKRAGWEVLTILRIWRSV